MLSLGALDASGDLTELGNQMAALPLEPTYSRAIILAKEMGCIRDIITIVSMLAVENIFFIPNEKREEAKLAKSRFAAPEGKGKS